MEWRDMEGAPRDGTWILLEGEFAGGGTSSVIMAQFDPHKTDTGVYEWRTLMPSEPSFVEGPSDLSKPEWNWYCEGRASGWLPAPPLSQE